MKASLPQAPSPSGENIELRVAIIKASYSKRAALMYAALLGKAAGGIDVVGSSRNARNGVRALAERIGTPEALAEAERYDGMSDPELVCPVVHAAALRPGQFEELASITGRSIKELTTAGIKDLGLALENARRDKSLADKAGISYAQLLERRAAAAEQSRIRHDREKAAKPNFLTAAVNGILAQRRTSVAREFPDHSPKFPAG